jgi:hypothetical protein
MDTLNNCRDYPNPNNLHETVVVDRIQTLDVNAKAICFMDSLSPRTRVDSILLDAQIVSLLSTSATTAELATVSRLAASKQNAKNIPSWATWSEAEAQTWGNANIGTPLTTGRSSLPETLTLATTRTAIIMLLNILDKMWVMQWSLARMTIALRDKTWPDLGA